MKKIAGVLVAAAMVTLTAGLSPLLGAGQAGPAGASGPAPTFSKDVAPIVYKNCVGCHRTTDAHAGRFGEDCATCHGNEDWKTTSFDRQRSTR